MAGIVRETIGATRHIVSTTLTTVGGFIPLLLFTGGDFWPPLAIVIAGGVGFSVTLSLLFTPAVYRWLHEERAGWLSNIVLQKKPRRSGVSEGMTANA